MMKITLKDAEGFAIRTSTGVHAIITMCPVACCLISATVAGLVGHFWR